MAVSVIGVGDVGVKTIVHTPHGIHATGAPYNDNVTHTDFVFELNLQCNPNS